MSPTVFIKKAKKLYDRKAAIVNGNSKLIKKYYTLQVIRNEQGKLEVSKRYIDADNAVVKVK